MGSLVPAVSGRSPAALEAYRELERRIQPNTLDALRARWDFGCRLLGERAAAGGNRLPNGRLEELASALAISRAEIKNRMQFAEEYATEEEAANALARLGSWHEIVRCGLGGRQRQEPGDTNSGADAALDGEDGHEDEFDAFRVPVPLWTRLRAVTEAAYAAGAALGNNHPGAHGVGALLDFVEGNGRKAWGQWLASRAIREAA